jgi:hypothetical protein
VVSASIISVDADALDRYWRPTAEGADRARERLHGAAAAIEELLAGRSDIAIGAEPPRWVLGLLDEIADTSRWIADIARTVRATQHGAMVLGITPSGQGPGEMAATVRLGAALADDPRRFAIASLALLTDPAGRAALVAELRRRGRDDGEELVAAARAHLDPEAARRVRLRLTEVMRSAVTGPVAPLDAPEITELFGSLTLAEHRRVIAELGLDRMARLVAELPASAGRALVDAIVRAGDPSTVLDLAAQHPEITLAALAEVTTPGRRRALVSALTTPDELTERSDLAVEIARTLVPAERMEVLVEIATDPELLGAGIGAIVALVESLDPGDRDRFISRLDDHELDQLVSATLVQTVDRNSVSRSLRETIRLVDAYAPTGASSRARLFRAAAGLSGQARDRSGWPVVVSSWSDDEIRELTEGLARLLTGPDGAAVLDELWRKEDIRGVAMAEFAGDVLDSPNAFELIRALVSVAYDGAPLGSQEAFDQVVPDGDGSGDLYPVATRLGTVIGAISVAIEERLPSSRDELYAVVGLLSIPLGLVSPAWLSAGVGMATLLGQEISERQRDQLDDRMRAAGRQVIDGAWDLAVPRDEQGYAIESPAADRYKLQYVLVNSAR